MERFLKWFDIKIGERRYVVIAMLRTDESVVFVIHIDGKQLRVYKDENDQWSGNGDPLLVQKIGVAIEQMNA